MTNNDGWLEALQERIEVITWWPDDDYAPKPTEEEFAAFEQEFGVRLPDNYKKLATAFGGGTFCVMVYDREDGEYSPSEIYELLIPRIRNKYAGMEWFTKIIRKGTGKHFPLKDEEMERIRRIVIFLSERDGYGQIGFDPEDVRDEATHECGIYSLDRGGTEFRFVAASLPDFFTEEIFLNEQNWARISDFYEPPKRKRIIDAFLPAINTR